MLVSDQHRLCQHRLESDASSVISCMEGRKFILSDQPCGSDLASALSAVCGSSVFLFYLQPRAFGLKTPRTSKMSNASEDVSSISTRKSAYRALFVYKDLGHAHAHAHAHDIFSRIEEKRSPEEQVPASWT
jgi:hypothetical protein